MSALQPSLESRVFTFPDRLIEGLFLRLPPLDKPFPPEKQQEWLRMATLIFDVLYPSEAEVGREGGSGE